MWTDAEYGWWSSPSAVSQQHRGSLHRVLTARCLELYLSAGLILLATTTAGQEPIESTPSLEQRASQFLQDGGSRRDEPMEELVVEGVRLDPAAMDFLEMEQIYGQKASASRNFKIGKYEEAYPDLLELAKMGFKDAQARVGYILLHGLGGQPKSNIKALGWLGVASQGTTRPQYRNIFRQLLEEVPEHQKGLVDMVVADYRAKFDSDRLGIECWHSNINHIRQFTCRYSDEMYKYFNHMNMNGLPF